MSDMMQDLTAGLWVPTPRRAGFIPCRVIANQIRYYAAKPSTLTSCRELCRKLNSSPDK